MYEDDNLYCIIEDFMKSQERKSEMSIEKPRKFWMITGDGNSPKVRHYNLADARKEAERLAISYPGTEFYVLQSIEMVQHSGVIRHTL